MLNSHSEVDKSSAFFGLSNIRVSVNATEIF